MGHFGRMSMHSKEISPLREQPCAISRYKGVLPDWHVALACCPPEPKPFPLDPGAILLTLGLPDHALTDGVGGVYKGPLLRAKILQHDFGTQRKGKGCGNFLWKAQQETRAQPHGFL
jgi:hypothetical protein